MPKLAMCSKIKTKKQKGAKIKYNTAIPTSNYGALNTHTPHSTKGELDLNLERAPRQGRDGHSEQQKTKNRIKQ